MTGDQKANGGLFAALCAAQQEMEGAVKDKTNPAFRSKYADLASVMDACMPALNKHGIAVLQPTCEENGQRYVRTVLAHTSGETAECLVPLIVSKNDMQGYGSAVTYARRYGLMCMAGIAPEDDDGNAASKAPPSLRVGDAEKWLRKEESAMRQMPAAADAEAAISPLDDINAFKAAVQTACDSLAAADTLEALAAIWKGLPRDVQADMNVSAAKDASKKALSAA